MLLAEADALVNNMRAGATDKVVYEAAATCLPVLGSNPRSTASCRPSCSSTATTLPGWRTGSGRSRRPIAPRWDGSCAPVRERDHSVEGWARRVVEVATR